MGRRHASYRKTGTFLAHAPATEVFLRKTTYCFGVRPGTTTIARIHSFPPLLAALTVRTAVRIQTAAVAGARPASARADPLAQVVVWARRRSRRSWR
jgi:hypothetical protein